MNLSRTHPKSQQGNLNSLPPGASIHLAKIGIDRMFSSRAEIKPGFVNWISSKITGFVPKSLTEKIASGLYKDAL